MRGATNSSAYRLVVFDCDGTLVDSQHSILAAMCVAFEGEGLPTPRLESVRRIIGLTLEVAVGQLLEEVSDSEEGPADPRVDPIAEGYRKAFHDLRIRTGFHEPLYPGAREVLERLDQAQVLLGVATGMGRRRLLPMLEHHGLAGFFTTLQTADEGPGKPHPAMLERAMAEAGSTPQETLVIGDTVFDIQMAVSAGVSAFGVSWGYHETQDLLAAGASRVLGSFADLVPALAN